MFMLEKAMVGRRRYWVWVGCVLLVIGVGFHFYLRQLSYGLGITGMSRNISWGLYIGQFTFLVGVAASAVMVVLPYYLHDRKEFGRMTILGEFLAVSAVTMCMLFIFVDMGQPMRVLNVILYPHPGSLMFWDMISLGGYLLLNAIITFVMLSAHRQETAPPRWIKPVILLSIPWAISIHTVTAFLYCGIPGRMFWRTAVLAPRFLASAFASGPALLILLSLLIRKVMGYDVGKKAIGTLAVVVTYAMVINVFLLLMELFTAFYRRVPELTDHFKAMYLGTVGPSSALVWGRLSLVLMFVSLVLLLVPAMRHNEKVLAVTCGMVFGSLWIDKGICMVICGFLPSPFGAMTRYVPTVPEMTITLGIWGVGALLATVFYKIAVAVEAQREVPDSGLRMGPHGGGDDRIQARCERNRHSEGRTGWAAMTSTIIFYAVLYASVLVFLVASVVRAVGYARLPLHLRWELYPVPHEAKERAKHGGSYFEMKDWWTQPVESDFSGEVRCMLEEILFLKGLREFKRRMWYRSYPFHLGLYLAIGASALLLASAVLSIAAPTCGRGGLERLFITLTRRPD